jgi:hypothetical protein
MRMWSHALNGYVDVAPENYNAFCEANVLAYEEKTRQRNRNHAQAALDYWDERTYTQYANHYTKVYRSTRPFDGIDPKKWPNTYQTAMLLYYNPEWHRMTTLVADPEEPRGQTQSGSSEKEKANDNCSRACGY